jgi:hypothetical protein
MTCFIASADPIFQEELTALVGMMGASVVSAGGDLLLYDMDNPIDAPECRKTIRFSRNFLAGADFIRPFSYRTLIATLQAENGEEPHASGAGYVFLAMEKFSPTERRLLDVLLQADGGDVTFEEIYDKVFGGRDCRNELKVYIRHLRSKLEVPTGIRVIETVRNVGYRFRSDRAVRPYAAKSEGNN